MARNILILGASYGSLLGTKLLMAGHNVTLVCRNKTAELINRDGTEVRIKLRDEPTHRAIFSRKLADVEDIRRFFRRAEGLRITVQVDDQRLNEKIVAGGYGA